MTDMPKAQNVLAPELPQLLSQLRAAIADADIEEDTARELYSELLEQYDGNSDAIEQIRRLGRELNAAVDEGQMPRALVLRGTSRK